MRHSTVRRDGDQFLRRRERGAGEYVRWDRRSRLGCVAGSVLDAFTFFKRVDDSFDPGMGFIRRRAMEHSFATLGITLAPTFRTFRS